MSILKAKLREVGNIVQAGELVFLKKEIYDDYPGMGTSYILEDKFGVKYFFADSFDRTGLFKSFKEGCVCNAEFTVTSISSGGIFKYSLRVL